MFCIGTQCIYEKRCLVGIMIVGLLVIRIRRIDAIMLIVAKWTRLTISSLFAQTTMLGDVFALVRWKTSWNLLFSRASTPAEILTGRSSPWAFVIASKENMLLSPISHRKSRALLVWNSQVTASQKNCSLSYKELLNLIRGDMNTTSFFNHFYMQLM